MSKSLLTTVAVIIAVAIVIWFMRKQSNTQTDLNSTPTITPLPTASPSPSPTQTIQQSPGPVMTLAGGLKIQDIVVGTGKEAKNGKTLSMHYVGTLENGTKFDSSLDRGAPFDFVIGTGQVIEGWEKGILGMKVGGKRKLIIPTSLGYGSTGAGNLIPPNATLIFEVQLLAVN